MTMTSKLYPKPMLLDFMVLQEERIAVATKTTSLKAQIKQIKAESRRLNKNRKAQIKRRLQWYFDYCAIDKRCKKSSIYDPDYKEYKNKLIIVFADHIIFEYERNLK